MDKFNYFKFCYIYYYNEDIIALVVESVLSVK